MADERFLEIADIETASEDYASRFSGAAGEYFLDVQARITLALLRDLPQARILDVGGGHAQLAVPLAEAGHDVTVTGSDDGCRARLDRFLAPDRFSYLTCDSLHLPYGDRSFDAVISFRLLPHVERWQDLLAELCRVADTCVIMDYPDRRSTNILYEYLFAMKKKMEGNTRPFTLFSRDQIAGEMSANSFAKPAYHPEFFFPMVVHRRINNRIISSALEKAVRFSGMTSLLGSPVIFRADRKC